MILTRCPRRPSMQWLSTKRPRNYLHSRWNTWLVHNQHLGWLHMKLGPCEANSTKDFILDVSMILSNQEATETTEAPLYTSGSLPRPRFKSLWTSWFQKVDCERQVCDAWPARCWQEQHCQQSPWLRQPCQPGQEEEQEEGGFCKQIQVINWDTKNKGKYE